MKPGLLEGKISAGERGGRRKRRRSNGGEGKRGHNGTAEMITVRF